MAKIIAFYNNKGGVAKTTTATNVAGVLSLQHKRVLLIDGDPQGHTSLTFGVDADDLQTTLGAYLSSNWDAKQASKYFIKVNDYLDVVPSNQSLSDFIISVSAEDTKFRNKHLKNFIEPIKDEYDYIIFDMAPAVDIILENIVEIVDDLIVVAVPETYAVKNAETTLKITDDKHVVVRYIVPTKTQLNTNTHKFMLENLREVAEAHHIKMTDTYIPNLIAFSEAVSIYSLPLALVNDSRYKKTQQYYKNLVKELGY
ncbi:transcriptional regulator [Ligilactobacillus salivarius]|uniref:ParA family protein n=1 Tax=Bacillota TaxID=1239 RepID=UPI0006698F81|nr:MULTISPECIES: ParA family protein [Bacillota]MDU7191673.1 ParA family protein [Veillonella sp.]OQR06046.1 transcriptional regulator [Ligilactobacillus salivarius]PLA29509.1 ParA family protein [Lactobacillus crispatus]